MLPAERHAVIARALERAPIVATDELVRELHVSVETVRRDLVQLERAGSLRRVHGGAAAAGFTGFEPPFEDRATLATAGKTAMGRAAAGLVMPGQTLVFDVGTSVLEVARALPRDFVGTVATCSLLVAAELAGRRGVTVLVSGGRVRAGDLSLSNADAVGFFADLRPDVAFVGSGGVDADVGLTDFHREEVPTRRVIIANAARSYVLADSTKLGRTAPHRVCGLGDFDALMTDGPAPDRLRAAAERAGTAIITAEADTAELHPWPPT